MMLILKYACVGGLAAIVDFAIFLLLYIFSVNWFMAAFISFVIATTVNYLLSIQYLFESGIRLSKHCEIITVFFVSGIGLVVNQLVLYAAIDQMEMSPSVAKLGASSIVFLWNYFARRNFVFKKINHGL